MKLYKSTPIGDDFETELLHESDDINLLKAFGFEYADENNVDNRVWVSETIMGDEKLESISKWVMYLPDKRILTICEENLK